MPNAHDIIVAPSSGGLLATPLLSHLHHLPQPGQPSIDAADVLRRLITHAGALPDVTTDGSTFLLIVASPQLLAALAAYAAAPVPAPMPLFDRVAL